MYVTTVDFQANMDKYLAMVSQEDIFITANGKTVAQMTQPRESVVDSLRGLLKDAPSGITARSIREERLERYESHV
ncbi:MAG: type II toxin-antitoxin system Phd/YefM family antitoxin [Selenomonas ruminantium]|nr:type II toxin-antitoxin system Phd/YefM family antitoxin [Selenomonas ruminantium]